MRRLPVLPTVLILFLVPACLSALCGSHAYWVWPPSGPIPPNAVLLVEVSGTLQATFHAGPPEAELRSGNEIVPLIPEFRLSGQMKVEQALYRPSRTLSPGVAYSLYSNALDEGPLGYRDLEGFVPYRWIARGKADRTPPLFAGELKVSGSRNVPLGCGPAVEVDIEVPLVEAGPAFALAWLTPLPGRPGRAGQYILPILEGLIHVGHGMCSGAFRLKTLGWYSVRVMALDGAGNPTAPWSDPISFKVPPRGTGRPRWWSRPL